MTRIRAEMAKKGGVLLEGIIEADETYIGGKPRKKNKRSDDEPAKRGRGTEKDAIIGAVQRGGKVIAQLAPNLTGRTILEFIRSAVNLTDSELITDEYQAYNLIGKEMKHAVINHKEQFADGETHTNTIEGFWSLLKRVWYGSHHHYTTGYTPLYVAEACYKYNYRETDIFAKFLRESMGRKMLEITRIWFILVFRHSREDADQISVGRSLGHQQVLGRSLNNLCKSIQEKEGFCKLNPNF